MISALPRKAARLVAAGCVAAPVKASPKVEKAANSSSLTFEKSDPLIQAKAQKQGRGGLA